MSEGNLLTERRGQIQIVTINRPERMNALDRPTLMEGAKLIKELHYDKDTRVVIVTGAGEKAFCAGADLKERENMSMSEVRQYIRRIRDTFTDIENLPMPVICAINGVALGGGLELALACDIRIASENALLGLTEVTLGIIPGGGGTQRLPRLVGRGKAKEMLLLGLRLTAQEALDIGLINHISPNDKLMDMALEMAEKIVNNPPIAVQQAKIAINRGMEVDLINGLEIESEGYEVCIPTKDRLEALAAFKEKRKPVYKGE
ncbi:enoyl-CoA hydratase-related protein [[Eubacterium] cellulosolvens]